MPFDIVVHIYCGNNVFAEQCGVDKDGQIDGCVDKDDNEAAMEEKCKGDCKFESGTCKPKKRYVSMTSTSNNG